MFSSDKWFGAEPSYYNSVATQSLRFDSAKSAVLSKTPNASNLKTWTWSAWVKRTKLGVERAIWSVGASSVDFALFFHTTDQLRVWTTSGGAVYYTERVFRDTSAWYHIAITSNNVSPYIRLYINGVLNTTSSFDNRTSVPGTSDLSVNTNAIHRIGAWNNGGLQYFDGYLADVNHIDGTAVSDTSDVLDEFIEIKNGVCIPKKYTGSYGTNGYRLEFKQTGLGSGSSSTIGADTANSNHYDSSGIVASDCNMPDSPENNFCTLNPLDKFDGTLTEGNLKYNNGSSFRSSRGNFEIPSSGKWYFEVLNVSATSGSSAIFAGLAHPDSNISAQPNNGSTTKLYGIYNDSSLGILSNGSQSSSTSNTISADSILQFAIDADNNKFYVGINNSYYSNATTTNGDPSAGSNPTESIDLAGYRPFVGAYSNTGILNCGQDPSFAGEITAGTATPSEGAGVFKYAPPTGFLALCSANIPESTIGPNSDTQADDYFNTVLYAGTGSSNSVTGVGFQPDWVWIKKRSGGTDRNAILTDSSRGVTKHLSSALQDAQFTNTNGLTAFGADGFTVGSYDSVNESGSSDKYVAWNWKANGSTTSSDGNGSITSTVQVNATAGFSIVTFTGNNTDDATIGHGLGTTPAMIITKNLDDSVHWRVWHKDLTSTHTLYLASTLYSFAPSAHSNGYIKTVGSTTYSTFKANVDSNGVNGASDSMLSYCFAEVEGYSKFGKYIGNGDADGTFVYLGFRPAFFLHKRTNDSEDWHIIDSVRNPTNKVGNVIFPNKADPEVVYTSEQYDILSNGIKLRNNGGSKNGSGDSYVYMAFAEAPFKYANAR